MKAFSHCSIVAFNFLCADENVLVKRYTRPRENMINSEIPTSSTLASLNFPSDVLCIAFQFIPLGELYRNAVFVCQEWRSVADSEAFWKCGLSSAVINALNNGIFATVSLSSCCSEGMCYTTRLNHTT